MISISTLMVLGDTYPRCEENQLLKIQFMENYQYGVIKLDVHDRGFGPYSCLGVRFCQGSGGGG